MDEIERQDLELVRLARARGAWRLRLGEVLEALASSGQHRELGFSSAKAYCLERVSFGPRWAGDSRALARRLEDLPAVRAAVAAGLVSWAKGEVVARVATAEDEIEWIRLARCSSVRALKALVRAERESESGLDEDQPEPRARVTRSVDRRDLWAFERTRMLIEALDGHRSTDGVVEALLAEAQAELVELGLGDGLTLGDLERAARRPLRERVERFVEAAEVPVADDVPDEIPDDAVARDGALREASAQLSGRDLALGRLARAFFAGQGWRRLGYESERHYCRDRLGMSWSSLKARMTLAGRCRRLPEVAEAVEDGRLGFEAAGLVARVATSQTVDAWIDRASQRTFKHLREEVEAAELTSRVTGETDAPEPPNAETLERVFDMERGVLTGQMFGTPLAPGPGHAVLGLSVREDLALWWAELEDVFQRSELPGSFVGWACRVIWETWERSWEARPKYHEIYVRDRYRCASPTCERRDVTPHHLIFRSQGGPDTPENTAGLCSECHLELVHALRSVRIWGHAARPSWESALLRVSDRALDAGMRSS